MSQLPDAPIPAAAWKLDLARAIRLHERMIWIRTVGYPAAAKMHEIARQIREVLEGSRSADTLVDSSLPYLLRLIEQLVSDDSSGFEVRQMWAMLGGGNRAFAMEARSLGIPLSIGLPRDHVLEPLFRSPEQISAFEIVLEQLIEEDPLPPHRATRQFDAPRVWSLLLFLLRAPNTEVTENQKQELPFPVNPVDAESVLRFGVCLAGLPVFELYTSAIGIPLVSLPWWHFTGIHPPSTIDSEALIANSRPLPAELALEVVRDWFGFASVPALQKFLSRNRPDARFRVPSPGPRGL